MKVECSIQNLSQAVSLASRVTGKNLSLPVLSCLLLVAGEGKFKIRATNLDLGVEIEIPGKVTKDGIAAVPAGVFSGTVGSIQGDTVTLEGDDTTLSIKTRQGTATINLLPAQDFPVLPYVKGKAQVSLPSERLAEGIRSVFYAASQSSIKPELASVYVYKDGKSLVFVATDSFRLAERTLSVATGDFEPILIPARNIPDILRFLEAVGGDVELRINESQCAFVADKLYMTSRLIDGSFPDYRQIIPKEKQSESIVLKQDFIAALKRMAVFADKFNQVTLSVSPTKKVFVMKARNTEVGESEDSIPATLTGQDIEISFNHRYLADCLPTINSDSISLSLAGVGRAMVIRGVPDQGFLYLIMPMNR